LEWRTKVFPGGAVKKAMNACLERGGAKSRRLGCNEFVPNVGGRPQIRDTESRKFSDRVKKELIY
jgi:hypothetical protein